MSSNDLEAVDLGSGDVRDIGLDSACAEDVSGVLDGSQVDGGLDVDDGGFHCGPPFTAARAFSTRLYSAGVIM